MIFQGRAQILIKRAYVKVKSPNRLESVSCATERDYTWTKITEAVLSHSEPTWNHYFANMLLDDCIFR